MEVEQARLPAIRWVSKPMTSPDRRACLCIISHSAVAQRLAAPAALAPDQCRNLVDSLAQIADPRHRRGRRHALGAVLAVAAAAVLAGARSLAAIGEWASDAPQPVWPRWGCATTAAPRLAATRRGHRTPRAGPRRSRRVGPGHQPVAGLDFPHATQALRVTRQVRSLHSRRWRTVTVYAVTNLTAA
jgi:hypothetical protein